MFFFLMKRPPPKSTLFPYTTLFRSRRRTPRPTRERWFRRRPTPAAESSSHRGPVAAPSTSTACRGVRSSSTRSEEHTSELQSPCNLVCRLLLQKKILHKFCTALPSL